MSKQLLFIPGPVTVAEPVLAAMAKPMIDHRGPEFKALQAAIVSRLKPVFGTAERCRLARLLGHRRPRSGDDQHVRAGRESAGCPIGVFGNRFAEIARTWGIEVEILPTEWGHGVDPEALKARLEADTKREIKGVVLTHNETSTGAQNDDGSAGRRDSRPRCLRAGRLGQRSGGERVHDGRVGLRRRRRRLAEGARRSARDGDGRGLAARVGEDGRGLGPRYYFDLRKAREFQAIGQTPWTPPVSIAYALDVALDRYAAEGPANVWARHERYTNAIIAAAKR